MNLDLLYSLLLVSKQIFRFHIFAKLSPNPLIFCVWIGMISLSQSVRWFFRKPDKSSGFAESYIGETKLVVTASHELTFWLDVLTSSWPHEFMACWLHDLLTSWLDDLIAWWLDVLADLLTLCFHYLLTWLLHEFMTSWLADLMTWWLHVFITWWLANLLTC